MSLFSTVETRFHMALNIRRCRIIAKANAGIGILAAALRSYATAEMPSYALRQKRAPKARLHTGFRGPNITPTRCWASYLTDFAS